MTNKLNETYEHYLTRYYDNSIDEKIVEEEVNKIGIIEEEFNDDILETLFKGSKNFKLSIDCVESEDKYDYYNVLLRWSWEDIDKDAEILFKRNRTQLTKEMFYTEIKGYLFNLIISLINL